MTKRLLTCCLILLIVSLSICSQNPVSGTLKIKFKGVRNNIGAIAIGINKTANGWPRKPDIDMNWEKENIRDGLFTVEIQNFAYGTYAISVLDDENLNFEMDKTMGIPKEGYGFSNNPQVKLKAPSFSDCTFRFNKSGMEIVIEMKYVGKK